MDTIYLDNAATAQRPSCVLAAVQEFYEQKNANPLRGFYPLSLKATESYQEARKTVQEFIHAEEPEEIIFTRNTTESLNLVAYSYGLNFLKEGDEIAVTIMEHHSNLLPWQMVSRMTGAKLHYLECTSEGELTDEELQKGINERTRLAIISPPVKNGGIFSSSSRFPYRQPIPIGPISLWPEKARKSASSACTSTGICGTLWAPSTTTTAPTYGRTRRAAVRSYPRFQRSGQPHDDVRIRQIMLEFRTQIVLRQNFVIKSSTLHSPFSF